MAKNNNAPATAGANTEDLEAKAKAEQEAKAKAEQEAKAKAEQEAKAKAEQEAKAKAEQEAKAKAEQEAKAKAEQEAKAKAEQEAKAKAEQEAKAKADLEANNEVKNDENAIFTINERKYTFSKRCPNKLQFEGKVYSKSDLLTNEEILTTLVVGDSPFITKL